MVNQNHELLLELWSRIKSHVAPKERLEVADILTVVFDEFGFIDEDILEEDLDKEMRAAVRSTLAVDVEEEERDHDEDSYGY